MSARRKKAVGQSNKAKPFTLKLTDSERAELERRAGEMALGTFIKGVLFADGQARRARGARAPVKDHAALAEVLACMGRSGLAANMHALSDAASTGTLRWDDDAPAAIRKACDDIAVMRLLLMKALGFRIEAEIDALAEQSLLQAFARSVSDGED